ETDEVNEAIGFFLHIFRIAPQIFAQDFFLVEKPPQKHGHKERNEAKRPPRPERKWYADKEPRRPCVHRVSHIGVWAGVYHLLPFFDTNVGCGEAVGLDDPKHKEERKQDNHIA